jgi:hypothetical protein
VKAGAFGEHPPGKDPLHLARELLLIDLDEGRGAGLFRRRARVADPRRHLERAKFDRVVDRNLKMRDPARDLVEGGEDRDRIPDDFGRGPARRKASSKHGDERCKGQPGVRPARSPDPCSFHHEAHPVNGPSGHRSACPRPRAPHPGETPVLIMTRDKRLVQDWGIDVAPKKLSRCARLENEAGYDRRSSARPCRRARGATVRGPQPRPRCAQARGTGRRRTCRRS